MADFRNWQHLCVYRGKQKKSTIFSGVGPGNTAIVLYGAPELNRDKLKEAFELHGGSLGINLQWIFQEKGQILISKRDNFLDENTIVLEALGAGADEVFSDEENDLIEIRTKNIKLQDIADIFELEDIEILHNEKVWLPRQMVPVEDSEVIRQLVMFLEEVLRWSDIWNITADFWILDEKLETEWDA